MILLFTTILYLILGSLIFLIILFYVIEQNNYLSGVKAILITFMIISGISRLIGGILLIILYVMILKLSKSKFF